jgi:purine-binding chemotaxis protein CheW
MSAIQRQLTVVIAGRSYALAGDNVLEVIRRPRVTRVPHGPPALVGVCNLRGTVLPVVSLARLMDAKPGDEERVVVLDHNGLVGLLVDAVVKLDVGAGAASVQPVDFVALLETGFKRSAPHVSAGRGGASEATDIALPRRAHRVLVSFLVQGQTFALPLVGVIEVLRLPGELAHVARADPAVLGIASIRDRSLPIISLAGILGFADMDADRSASRILVVDHEGARIGLVVQSIDAILQLDEDAIDAVPPILQRGRGQAELDAIGRPGPGRSLVSILSVPRLFANASVEATVAEARQEKTAMPTEQVASSAQEQFVVFDLGDERYGLPIAAVDEVLRLPAEVTRLPNGPRFVSGIINLRGRPVPIIDQRQRFDAPAAAGAAQPRVMIVTVGGRQAGFVVDAVSEILSVASNEVINTPPLSSERSAVFTRVANLGQDGRLILLIDPEELLSRAELDIISDIAARQTGVETA